MSRVARSIGLVVGIALFTVVGYVNAALEWLARIIVTGIDAALGVEIWQDRIQWNTQRFKNVPVHTEANKEVVDEPKSLQLTEFPLSPEQLIQKTRAFTSKDIKFGSKTPEVLAEDFQFIFPIVGPLTKEEFTTVFSSFKVDDAFPNSQGNYFGFTVDPLEPNRVWFFSRAILKHEGTLKFGKLQMPPTQKTVVHTPQAFSVSYDQEGRVYKFTGGYPVDKTVGNAGGLGGVLGIIYALGGKLPLGPEARPWKPSMQWEAYGRRLGQLQKEWKK